MNAKTAFMGVAMLLVGLVIGVPVLTAIFATGGPFSQLQGVAEGTCEYSVTSGISNGAYSTAPNDVTLQNGAQLSTLTFADAAWGSASVAGHGYSTDGTTGNFVEIKPTATPLTLPSTCNSGGTDVAAVAFDAGANTTGNSAVNNDAQLSSNPYSGILTAAILLIPLAIVAFFAFRFFRERM